MHVMAVMGHHVYLSAPHIPPGEGPTGLGCRDWLPGMAVSVDRRGGRRGGMIGAALMEFCRTGPKQRRDKKTQRMVNLP